MLNMSPPHSKFSPTAKISSAVEQILTYKPGEKDIDTLQDAISVLGMYARTHGIDGPDLEKLIKLFTSHECRISASLRICIIRDCMYPRQKVSTKIVMAIIGRFTSSQSMASNTLFQQILRWLIIVYDFLEDANIISKLYSLLLTKISYETTRQWICHLLYLSTTQALVTPWRAQLLLEEYEKSPSSTPLVALLRHYQAYKPAVVPGNLPLVKLSIFDHPNPDMKNAIRTILTKSSTETALSNSHTTNKRKRTHEQANAKSSLEPLKFYHNYGIDSITSSTQFVEKYHRLQFPQQISSFVENSGMLTLLLIYKGDALTWARFNSWLEQSLYSEDQLSNPELLRKVWSLVSYSKMMPVSVQNYLLDFLQSWDFETHNVLIYSLLSYLPFMDDQDFTVSIIIPFAKHARAKNSGRLRAFIKMLTALVRNWSHRVKAGTPDVANTLPTDHCRVIRVMAAFVDHHGLQALEKNRYNMELSQTVLDFFEEVLYFPTHKKFPVIVCISSNLFYLFYISMSAINMSRIAKLTMGQQTLQLENVLEKQFEPSTSYHAYIYNICDGVWLNKAFRSSAAGTVQTSFLKESFVKKLREAAVKVDFDLEMLLSIPCSVMFCRRAIMYMRSLEKKSSKKTLLRKPPGYSTLKANAKAGGLQIGFNDFRVGFLDALNICGYYGLNDLLYSSMKGLIAKKSAKETSNSK